MIADTEYLHINRAKIAHDVIDGEVVLVNVVNGFYFSLRGSAASLWAAIEEGRSFGDLCEWASAHYAVDPRVVADAASSFVTALVADEIVIPSADPPPADGERRAVPEAAGTPFATPVIERFTEMMDLLTLDPIHEVDDLGWPHRGVSLE
ncbi:MAG: PqqD family protein [Alphaproteobacteria bacterium]|nr:PqqD family protein [Alphaproteobacteria bacterium]